MEQHSVEVNLRERRRAEQLQELLWEPREYEHRMAPDNLAEPIHDVAVILHEVIESTVDIIQHLTVADGDLMPMARGRVKIDQRFPSWMQRIEMTRHGRWVLEIQRLHTNCYHQSTQV